MAMLDDLLKRSQPGVNPDLENLIATLMRNGGATQGQTASGTKSLQQQQPPSTLGTGAALPPSPPGAAQAMDSDQVNQTLRILIQKGVPPQVAQQAINNPQLLRDILTQIYRQQAGPQELPQTMPSGNAARPSAPPLGGGGGY